jgi:pyruvate dehydrogenase E1 component alpha subunit
MDKQYLIDFETEVKEKYEAGDIKAPVHLCGGNGDQLIEIFNNVAEDDWVFCSWRNHYHALLHGIPRDTLMDMIVRGKSMSVYSDKPKFYSSSIVGGILPIALGVAKSIKLKGGTNKIYRFRMSYHQQNTTLYLFRPLI